MKLAPLLGFLLTAWSADAAARPSARLTVIRGAGAEECLSSDEIEKAVATEIGYRALHPEAGAAIEVTFAHDESGFVASIAARDASGQPNGERTIRDEGDTCVELGKAVVLSVGVLLENLEPPTRSRAADRSEPPTDPGAPPAVPGPEAPLELRMRVEGTATSGASPEISPGMALAFGLRRATWSGDLEGRTDLAGTASVAGATFRSNLRIAQLVPCKHVGPFAACAIVGAGVIVVDGRNVMNARGGTGFHAALGGRIGVEPKLPGGLFLSVHAGLLAALTRTRVANGTQEVWATPPLGVSFGAGLGWVPP